MPGHRVDVSIFQDASGQWKKYVCPKCQLLLRDAVQPSCGHWLCQSCAEALFKSGSIPLKCPKDECKENLTAEDGLHYFPDRFVRKEILKLPVACQNKGCNWKGTFADYEAHQKACEYSFSECELCGESVPAGEASNHEAVCPKAVKLCPCAVIGCTESSPMLKSDLVAHLNDELPYHMELVVCKLAALESALKPVASAYAGTLAVIPPGRTEADGGRDEGYLSYVSHAGDMVETDGGPSNARNRASNFKSPLNLHSGVEKDGLTSSHPQTRAKTEMHKYVPRVEVENPYQQVAQVAHHTEVFQMVTTMQQTFSKFKQEVETQLKSELKKKDEEIGSLQASLGKMEKMLRAKNAEIEDRDFRLSLIENSNYDGSMVWKIPQFSQRMADAQSGKYTSIFSLPFYTGRYGYKMCLRLYILGDGIGKNTHMSLFFVIMRGEFDNILQWPFTYRVTFRLINQTPGGRDIIDTFQPDPMSSSFKKPKNDMNIASGCPRFVSHHELKNGGFIDDDTVFIKCSVDTSAIKHP